MLSRLTGACQSEKASQEQVSDKAAAGVTALVKLVQIVGKDCGAQELAQAAKNLVAASDKTSQTQQTLQQYPAALHALTASCTSALEVVQSVLPLQHAAEEISSVTTPPGIVTPSLNTAVSGHRKAGAAHDGMVIPTLEAAQAQYQHRQYDLCLLTLHILTDAAGTSAPEAQGLTSICKIHKHAAVQEWHKVLGLSLNSSEADIKRQYRKLAAQVHPDKCKLEGAEEAFKLLGRAVAHALSAADKNRGQVAEESDAEAGPAAAWWEEWAEEQPASRKRRHPTSKPTAEDEQQDQGLANMTTQELQAEVRKRQAAVLRPEPGSEEEQLNAFQRQTRLRVARTALGEHLQKATATAGRGFH
ncbi:TPA: hypothetical protein ACH3X1_015914 [Trebouxia sp. C0004]